MLQVSNRERKISSLQSQLTDLQNELGHRESEESTQIQSIKMLQDKHRHVATEVGFGALYHCSIAQYNLSLRTKEKCPKLLIDKFFLI